MRLVFLGPPGSGKGTQANVISSLFSIAKLSSGDMLRAAVNNNAESAEEPYNKIAEILKSGGLIPDDLMIDMISNKLSEAVCDKGFILDGFPRTLPQAKALDIMLGKRGEDIDVVIELYLDEKDLIDRVKLRYNCADCGTSYNYKTKPTKLENICDVCGGSSFLCRSDDNEEVLLNRLRMYNAETVVLKEYYEEQGKLYSINGNNKENKITEEIVLILRQKQLA